MAKVTSRAVSERLRKVMLITPLVLGTLWFVTVGATTYSNYRRLKLDYLQGAYRSVKGQIVNFRAGNPDHGGAVDTFTVSGVPFTIHDSIRAGYNRMQASGSPLRDGIRVDMDYVGDTIVKLKICQ